MIQAEAKVGVGGGGHLQLRDPECMYPHTSKVVWQEGDGKGWHDVKDLLMAFPGRMPQSYMMAGDFAHQSQCAGMYLLVEGREAFGKVRIASRGHGSSSVCTGGVRRTA